MATLSDLLRAKSNRTIHTVDQSSTVLAATERMNEHLIGALIVTDSGRMVGIFTERDVLRRVVAAHRDPAQVRLREVMTADVACCRADTPVDEARQMMKERRIRHLPVLDDADDLLGLVSIGDLNAWYTQDQEVTIHSLNEYLHGRV